jgi:hypothetical protein
MFAGETTAAGQSGGAFVIAAGEGSSEDFVNGGSGGALQMFGGAAQGSNPYNNGGDIEVTGGYSRSGYGGDMIYHSGFGMSTSSGSFDLATANAGVAGVSGSYSIVTGTTSHGNTGSIVAQSGDSRSGHGGHINIQVGTGNSGSGGNLKLWAGRTAATGSVVLLVF